MTKSRKILGFIGLVLALFMGALDATIVNIALPNIMEELHTGLTDTSWVATIYVLAMSVFIITVSKLADIYDRKLVMLIGVVIFGIFSFACMMADSLLLLIIFRFFQGIGGAILTPIVLPMGIELFGKENTSRITAIMGAFSALAAAGGPVIGGLIVHWTTYHWIFGINVPIAIFAFLMILVGTKESYDLTISKNIDWLGMIFLTCTLGGLIFGLLEGHEYGWGSQTIIASFIISVVGLFFLFLTERRVKSPMVEVIKIAAQKTDNLPEPKKRSNYRKIYDANQLLINGVETVSSSVPQLSTSLKTISGGQAKVGTAIKLLAQKDELASALKVIVKEKNEQLSRAFDNVFIIGAIIVLICTPLALMTEKRKDE